MKDEQFLILNESFIPQMSELFRSAFAGEPWNDDWSDSRKLNDYIKDLACSFNSLNYGLLIGGRLAALSIGSVRHWWEGTNYIIEEFCVSPEVQNSGVGTRFLGLIEQDACSRGIAGIFLQTDRDKPSYNFYRKNGFGELTAHVSFYKKIQDRAADIES